MSLSVYKWGWGQGAQYIALWGWTNARLKGDYAQKVVHCGIRPLTWKEDSFYRFVNEPSLHKVSVPVSQPPVTARGKNNTGVLKTEAKGRAGIERRTFKTMKVTSVQRLVQDRRDSKTFKDDSRSKITRKGKNNSGVVKK